MSKIRSEIRAELLKVAIRKKLHRELTDQEEQMIELSAALMEPEKPDNEDPKR